MGRYELFLALRYLRARRKQAFTSVVTAVSILGIGVGVSALIIALALLTGFQEDIQSKIIGANAHVVVLPMGGQPIDEYRRVMELAEAVPGVVSVAPAVLQAGMITSGFQPHFVNIKGIDPEAEAATTDLLERVVEGGPEGLQGAGPPGIILGRDLAEALLARVGDRVRLIVQAPDMLTPFGVGGVRARHFQVAGVFEAGMFEYDNTWALIDLAQAQDLFELGDGASLVEVRVADIYGTDPVVEELRQRLGDGYFVIDWKQQNRLFFSALKLEKMAMFITISLIVMVAALNIVATLVLMVMEKNRDIGILISMGATRRGILLTFIIQGLVIGILGTAGGCLLGVAVAQLLDHYRLISLPEQVYYLSYVPFSVRALDVVAVTSLAVAISFLATIYPAWRASRLDPVEALRYE